MVTVGGRAHSLDEVMYICKLGYPFVEYSLSDPTKVEAELEKLTSLKELYNIDLMAHFPNEDNPFDIKVLSEKFVPRMKKLLDLSSKLGIKKGTFHFWMDRRWASQDLVDEKISLVDNMVSYGKDRGIVLCIENLSERYDSFAKAFNSVPDLMMTLDIGHAQLLASRNTSFDFIDKYFNRIQHVHVHDNYGGVSVKDDLHLCLGEGIVDYPAILTALKERGYDSTISMEVKVEDMPSTRKEVERYIM